MQVDLRVASEYLESVLAHPASPNELRLKNNCFYEWDLTIPYSSDMFSKKIEKKSGLDFKILNFADIQCHDGEAFSEVGEFYEETIDKLISLSNPDLITLTGDNAFDPLAYLKLIRFIESYQILWAPVMGNADHTGLVSEFWADYQLHNASHCLFDYGPRDMGDGNYIINITQNGKIVHTLFMMDTHHEKDTPTGTQYEHLTFRQIEWYRWAVLGIAKEEGHVVPSTVIFHIPVPEYADAWQSIIDESGQLLPEFKQQRYCQNRENMGCPDYNNGFFDLCRELGSTKLILCGHDHRNCFAIPYKGITLAYALKTGYGCYWDRDTNGGTVLCINDNGEVSIDEIFINPKDSKVKKFMLDYYGINLWGNEQKNF